MELGQDERRFLVGHHLGAGDEVDVRRMGDRHRVDIGLQRIDHRPGIGRHLQHHRVPAG